MSPTASAAAAAGYEHDALDLSDPGEIRSRLRAHQRQLAEDQSEHAAMSDIENADPNRG